MEIKKLAKLIETEFGAKKVPSGQIRIQKLPKGGKQRISTRVLEEFKDNIEIQEDGFLFKTETGDVFFKIIHEPGRYCITCGERLPDFGGNGTAIEAVRSAQCRAHVATHGKKAKAHPRWPHGYVNRPNTYTCSVEDRRK